MREDWALRFATALWSAMMNRQNLQRPCWSNQGVAFDRFVDESRPTTRKQRFRALNKTLLRVNHLRQHPVSPEIQAQHAGLGRSSVARH